jgi:hypothetical protein
MNFFCCKCSEHVRRRKALAETLGVVLYLALALLVMIIVLLNVAHSGKLKFTSAGSLLGGGPHSAARVISPASAKAAVK